jgi:hypothetical protein
LVVVAAKRIAQPSRTSSVRALLIAFVVAVFLSGMLVSAIFVFGAGRVSSDGETPAGEMLIDASAFGFLALCGGTGFAAVVLLPRANVPWPVVTGIASGLLVSSAAGLGFVGVLGRAIGESRYSWFIACGLAGASAGIVARIAGAVLPTRQTRQT